MSARLLPSRLAMIRAHHANGMYGSGVRAAEIADVLTEVDALAIENERLAKGAYDALMVAMTRYTAETVSSMVAEAIAADRAMRGAS